MSDKTPTVNENLDSPVETNVIVFEEMRLKLLDNIKDNYNKSTEILRKIFLLDPKEAEVKIISKMIIDEIQSDTTITKEMIVALLINIITLITSWLVAASKATVSTTSTLYNIFKKISDEDSLFKPMLITVEDKFSELGSVMNDLCSNINNGTLSQRNGENGENGNEYDKVNEIKESVHPAEFIELTETSKVMGSVESYDAVGETGDSETSVEFENFIAKYTKMFNYF